MIKFTKFVTSQIGSVIVGVGALITFMFAIVTGVYAVTTTYSASVAASGTPGPSFPGWIAIPVAVGLAAMLVLYITDFARSAESTQEGRVVELPSAFGLATRYTTITSLAVLVILCSTSYLSVKAMRMPPIDGWILLVSALSALHLYVLFSPLVFGYRVRRVNVGQRTMTRGDQNQDGHQGKQEPNEEIAEVRKPRTTFADMHGMRPLKQRLLEAASPILASSKKQKGKPKASEKSVETRNGIMLFGPPGNGKTGIAEALAGELGVPLLMLDYSKVVSQWVGETPRRIAAAFKQAKAIGPCVLFIDEIDSFLVSRDSGSNRSQEADNIVNLLLTELVQIRRFPVVLVAATNRLEKLDAAAIREGRFDYKIEVTAPDEEARIGLLQDSVSKHAKGVSVDATAVLEAAKRWEGFSVKRLIAVGEELPAFIKEEGARSIGFPELLATLRRVQGRKGRVPANTKSLAELVLHAETAQAVKSVASRIKDPLRVERLGGTLPGGVLFYGPSGTGKTAVARALAKETGWAFLSVAGPDLLKNMEELERVYADAKDIRPTLIFIDEADEILRERQYSSASAITNKLLTIMDGADGRVKDVIFLAATNHPDNVDPALLRGGRFTEKVPFHVADESSAAVIVKAWLSRKKVQLVGSTAYEIAEFLSGQSPANIEAVLQYALNLAIDEHLGDEVSIGQAHLEAAAKIVLS